MPFFGRKKNVISELPKIENMSNPKSPTALVIEDTSDKEVDLYSGDNLEEEIENSLTTEGNDDENVESVEEPEDEIQMLQRKIDEISKKKQEILEKKRLEEEKQQELLLQQSQQLSLPSDQLQNVLVDLDNRLTYIESYLFRRSK